MPDKSSKLTLDSVKEYARELAGRRNSHDRINEIKREESNVRAERRLLRVMFTILLELGLEATNESALRLVCSEEDTEKFLQLEKEQQYKKAGELLQVLREHISQPATPLAINTLIRLDECPERLQRKAMIMAIYDLTDN